MRHQLVVLSLDHFVARALLGMLHRRSLVSPSESNELLTSAAAFECGQSMFMIGSVLFVKSNCGGMRPQRFESVIEHRVEFWQLRGGFLDFSFPKRNFIAPEVVFRPPVAVFLVHFDM